MKFKYKLCLIVFLFLTVYFIFFCKNVKAFTFTYENNTYNLNLPFNEVEHPDFLVLKFTNSSGFQVLYPHSNYDLPFYRTSGDGIQYYIKDTKNFGQWDYYNYDIKSNSWTGLKTTYQKEAKIFSNGGHVADLVYSKSDVILFENGSIWFEATKNYNDFNLEIFELEKEFYNFSNCGYYMRTNFILDMQNFFYYNFEWSLDGVNFNYIRNGDTNYIRGAQTISCDINNKKALSICFEVLKCNKYYFRYVDRRTNETSNVVEVDMRNDILYNYEHIFEDEDVYIPTPELNFISNFDENNNIFYKIATQFLDVQSFSNIKLAYRNITTEENLTEYFLIADCEKIFSPDNSLFRFVLPVDLRGVYEFCFFYGSNRSNTTIFFCDYGNTQTPLDEQMFYDFDTVPKIEFSEPIIGENLDVVYYDTQWFSSNLLYTVYERDLGLLLVQKWGGLETIYNEDKTMYKFRFSFREDCYVSYFLAYFSDTFYLRGEATILDVKFFSQAGKIELLKNKLFELYNKSFGFLTYPFILFFDICEKFSSINFSEPEFSIPNIYVPFYENEKPLISETNFNFNDIIESNTTFKTVHNLILIFVDAFIAFSFVSLFYKKWKEVFN